MVENKRRVMRALKDKKVDVAIDTKWPFIGPFLKFLEGFGIMKALEKITGTQLRKMLGMHIFVLLYMLKIIIGIPRTRGSEVLLGDMGAMRLIGFNVDRLMEGLCKRGDANQHGGGYKKNPLYHGLIYSIRQC